MNENINQQILYHQGSWRLEDLSQKIQVPASLVRKKIAYWQAQGLIEESSNDNFTLIENIEQHSRPDSGTICHIKLLKYLPNEQHHLKKFG